MTKKKRSSPAKNTHNRNTKSYDKPLWMKILRLIAFILASLVMILGIIGIVRTYFHI